MRNTHPLARSALTEAQLEDLVHRTCHGDELAWTALWLALAPMVERIAGYWRVTSRLSRCPDERRNIVTRVMGELRENVFRLLIELGERLAQRDGSYRPWFSAVARHSALKYVRSHPDYLGTGDGAGPCWATLGTIPEALADAVIDPIPAIDAHRVLALARTQLDPPQLAALCEWVRCDDFDEVAATLHLEGGGAAAKRLVRSAVARLRSIYAAPPADEGGASAPRREHGCQTSSRKIDRRP